MAVLARGEDQLVVDDPLRVSVEKRRRRVDVDRGALDECLVSFLGVFLGRVSEKA